MTAPPLPARYRYQKRTIGFQGARAVGRWRVKGTVITLRGTAAHFSDEIEAAWTVAERVLVAVPDLGLDAGVALLIVHVGPTGISLLLGCWEEGDGMRDRHFHASIDDPTRFTDVGPEHRGPSVWDLAVLAHEREAWLAHVLVNPGGPDVENYLADGLNGSV